MLRAAIAGLALLPFCSALGLAQDSGEPVAPEPQDMAPEGNLTASAPPAGGGFAILTLNEAELFEKSAWGQAATQAAERAAAKLSAENRAIEAALEKEERDLTEKRATMTAQQFSTLAREFDTRVEEYRQSQDAKVRAINRKLDDDRKTFFDLSVPLMVELLDEYGAVAIIGDDVLILSRSSADVTQRAIVLMNERLPAPAAESDPVPSEQGQSETVLPGTGQPGTGQAASGQAGTGGDGQGDTGPMPAPVPEAAPVPPAPAPLP